MAVSRICANPECDNWFKPVSDKALCCSVGCKNRKNYIFKTLEYQWEFISTTSRKKNYKILEYLQRINRIKVNREILGLMGFDFSVCYAPMNDQEGVYYYRFGNSLLKQIDENNFEITYYDHE